MTRLSLENAQVVSKLIREMSGDVLKELLAQTLAHVMEAEATAACGACYGVRDEGRLNQRNGGVGGRWRRAWAR